MTIVKNIPTLEELAGNPALAIDLSLDAIEALLTETDRVAKVAAAAKKALNASLESRFVNEIGAAFSAQAKDFGTVHVYSADYDIEVNRAKKVEWSQDELRAIAAKIQGAGDNPAEFIKTELTVEEKKYAAWPESIRGVFEPARTVRPGALTLKLSRKEAA